MDQKCLICDRPTNRSVCDICTFRIIIEVDHTQPFYGNDIVLVGEMSEFLDMLNYLYSHYDNDVSFGKRVAQVKETDLLILIMVDKLEEQIKKIKVRESVIYVGNNSHHKQIYDQMKDCFDGDLIYYDCGPSPTIISAIGFIGLFSNVDSICSNHDEKIEYSVNDCIKFYKNQNNRYCQSDIN
jgi:hypothetical protein